MKDLVIAETLAQPPHASEAFINEWGAEKLGFDSNDRLRQFFDAAGKYYGDLDYHNFEHVLTVTWEAMKLADLCDSKGDLINRKVLLCAALLHDAGYGTDLATKNSSSPEAYSADLFTAEAIAFDFSDDDIYQGRQIIFATKAGHKQKELSREERILIRADLANVGGDYKTDFYPNTLKLMTEDSKQKTKTGEAFDLSIFAKNNISALAVYFENDYLSLGKYDTSYAVWRAQALNNIAKFTKEVANQLRWSLPDLLKYIGNPAVNHVVMRQISLEHEDL